MKKKNSHLLFIFCTFAFLGFVFLGQSLFSEQINEKLIFPPLPIDEYLDTSGCLGMDECKGVLKGFYKDSSIDAKRVIDSAKKLETILFSFISNPINESLKTRDVDEEIELLTLYLMHANILIFAHDMGAIKDSKEIKQLDANIAIFMQASKQTVQTYLKYADYLFLKLAHGSNLAIHALPIIYRKVLLIDRDNVEARVKLAMWYITPSNENTSNFRGFIESAEKFIEELESVDRFNACLWYSIYYMKCYNERKGFEYLKQANMIFPHHIYIAHLWNNYKNGIIGM